MSDINIQNEIVIESIEIVSFGKLKMTRITPQPGINLLSAPNESGKTTLASFIRFIFYGFTSGRMQAIAENDKKLYTPWDNPMSEGAIYIRTSGGRYKIRRMHLLNGKETIEVFETSSGKRIDTGISPGEHFFGVNEQVFSRTAFFGQLSLPTSKDEYMAQQLQNIALTADEKVNTKKALDILARFKSQLSGRVKNPIIPKLMQERADLEDEYTKAKEVAVRVRELSGDIDDLNANIKECETKHQALESEKENHRKYESLKKLERLSLLEKEVARAEADYEQKRKKIKTEDLPDIRIVSELLEHNNEIKTNNDTYKKKTDELTKAKEDLLSLNTQKSDRKDSDKLVSKAKKLLAFRVIFAVFMLITVAFLLWQYFTQGAYIVYLGIPVVLFFVLGIASHFLYKKTLKSGGVSSLKDLSDNDASIFALQELVRAKEEKIQVLKSEIQEAADKAEKNKEILEEKLASYIDSTPDLSYKDQIESINKALDDIRESKYKMEASQESFRVFVKTEDLDLIRELAKEATEPTRELNIVDREWKFNQGRLNILEEQKRKKELEKAGVEGKGLDTSIIYGKLESIKTKLQDYNSKLASVELAIEYMEKASDQMKSTVSPKINSIAGELFNKATEGKYQGLAVNSELGMNFIDESGEKSCDYLSAGTRDNAYLSLRLALIKLMYGDVLPPIILDDAFVRFDDERLDFMLNLLAVAGYASQIFIFTCTERELQSMDKNKIPYNVIEL